MTEGYLYITVIILILLISHNIARAQETGKPGVTEAQYILIDYEDFNKSAISARGEEWTLVPVTVSLKLSGPFEGLSQRIERKNDNAESAETATVTITNKGLLDGSVMGEKFFLKLKRTEHGAWLITSAGKKVKCWPGRGHQDYSK